MARSTLHLVVLLLAGCAAQAAPPAEDREATIRTLVDGLMSSQRSSRELAADLLRGLGIDSPLKLREVLTTTASPDPVVADLIGSLNADDIRTRRDAADELMRRGRSAEPELWKLLIQGTPLESALLAEEILSKRDKSRRPRAILELLAEGKVAAADPMPEPRILPLKEPDFSFPRTKIEDDFSLLRGLQTGELMVIILPKGNDDEDDDR